MANIEGRESPEMYLKAIYLVRAKKNYCRHVDVAHQLGVSNSSVSVAINKLKEENYVTVNEDGMICLTDKGEKSAQMIYDKFCFLKNILEKLGLDSKMADSEACKIEHALSDEAFMQIKLAAEKKEE